MNITIKQDTITPDLRAVAGALEDATPLMRAIGVGIVSDTKRAFNEAELRAAPWAAKRDGSVATLKKSTALFRSIRVIGADSGSVTVGSDRPYAAIHQLGGKTRPRVITANGGALSFVIGGVRVVRKKVKHPGSKIPARPFFPFTSGGGITAAGERTVRGVIEQYIKARGGTGGVA
jgi:phage gpG-like protein